MAIRTARPSLGACYKNGECIDVYGLIGKMTAVPGQRDALASLLVDSTQSMPGCLSYVIATDPADADAAITKAKPLIAGFSNRVETVPIGGYGLGQKR
jgi:hypothetical protein